MTNDERERGPIESIDAARRSRRADEALAHEALVRAAEGLEPGIDVLLDAVPGMLAEAHRRRRGRDALAASVPLARRIIPRLAVAAALLVAISAALVLTGDGGTTGGTSWDDVLVAGNGVSDELILGSILDTESAP